MATGESIVYLSKDESTYTKMKSPFAKAPIKNTLPNDIIYEHLIHNVLFPSTRYRFVGISEDINGIRIVLQQKNIVDAYVVPTHIIRKTKCFRILERNAIISKTKRNFSRLYPTPQNFKKIDRLRRNEIHLKAVRTSS